jgi:hypothetical protein
MYNRVKNLIIAGFAGYVFHSYVVPSVPILSELFGIAFVIVSVLSMLESADNRKRAKVRAKKNALSEDKVSKESA